jgi:chromosome segregation ATPase
MDSSFLLNYTIKRCSGLKRRKVIKLDEVYLDQLAFDSNFQRGETNHNDHSHNTYASMVQELLKENKSLKEEVETLAAKLNEKSNQCEEALKVVDKAAKEYAKLYEKYKEIEDRLTKEHKRANILEVENTRNLDELKALKKARNELLAKAQKDEENNESRFRKFIKNLFGKNKNDD